MKIDINFDLDGTLVDLYNEYNWLEDLIHEKSKPYRNAKPLHNMRKLNKELKRLNKNGYNINIISWTSKNCSDEYAKKIIKAKNQWLKKHMGSVIFNNINIIPYGTNKNDYGNGILFDDEKQNRDKWTGTAYDIDKIIEVLQKLKQKIIIGKRKKI